MNGYALPRTEGELSLRALILIRHSESRVESQKPASAWGLTAEGRRRCAALASDLREFDLHGIFTSVEPKAAQTAELVAEDLGIGWRTAPGLHEHEREVLPWLGEEAWHVLLRRFFEHPDEMIFGLETATQALERFRAAVERIIQDQPTGDIAVVTHGTVMSLYIGHRTGGDPYAIWRELEMPDYRVLPLDDQRRTSES